MLWPTTTTTDEQDRWLAEEREEEARAEAERAHQAARATRLELREIAQEYEDDLEAKDEEVQRLRELLCAVRRRLAERHKAAMVHRAELGGSDYADGRMDAWKDAIETFDEVVRQSGVQLEL